MQPGVAALHSKGVRPEKGIKSPHETRPRAYVLVRLPEGHCWWDALAISADAEPHQKRKYWYLNTENDLVQFTALGFFSEIWKMAHSEPGQSVDFPTLLQDPTLLNSWRERCRTQLGAREPSARAPEVGSPFKSPLLSLRSDPSKAKWKARQKGFLHKMEQ